MGIPALTGTFNPNRVIVNFNNLRVTGWAEGDVIEVKALSPSFKSKVGVGGEVSRSIINDKRRQVIFRLLGQSTVNAFLQANLKLDENTGLGCGSLSITVLNPAGAPASVHLSPQAWIVKQPDFKSGEELGNIEWELEAAFTESTLIGLTATPKG